MPKLANAGDWTVQAKLKMLFLLIKEGNKGLNTLRMMINYDLERDWWWQRIWDEQK